MENGPELGEKFRTYLQLQVAWWMGSYGICYQFQPTTKVVETNWGAAAVDYAGAWLQRMWPARHESIVNASKRVYTSPNGRTLAEFMLLNKVLAPLVFPFLVATANSIVNRRQIARLAPVGFAASTVEPDLVASREPVAHVARTLTERIAVGSHPPPSVKGERLA